MAWQKPEVGLELAKAGYDVVMTPGQAYYLDMVQDEAFQEPGASWAGTVPPHHTYTYEAVAEFPAELAARMRGVQAVVLMEGQANLGQETQDLQVYVVPDVNAGAASLAYAAINPVVGLGTFVAQMLLRKQVADASTQEFMVTGPWADPHVEKLERGPKPAEVTAPQKPS